MDFIFFLFVAVLCGNAAVKIFSSQERNTVFNKRPIEVVDVKKYNKFCGILVVVFGIVAEITLFLASVLGGLIGSLLTLGLALEAVAVVIIYNKVEFKMLKKR